MGAAREDLGLVKLVRLANDDDLSAGFAAGEETVDGKLSPLKASVKPPKFDDCCFAGGARSSKDEFRACCADAGGGFEYSDRIDCFRSGRESLAAPEGVDVVLAERFGAEDSLLPKKSTPSNESAGREGFAAGCDPLGAARGAGSVVLGRAGGEIILLSSKRSIDWGCRLEAAG